MIKAVVFVPIRSNQGHTFPRRAWQDLLAQLQRFGGVTVEPAVSGRWLSGGRWYDESMLPHVVALTSWRQIPVWLAIVEWAQAHFEQEAMYIEIAGQPEIIDFRAG
ncbi:MAG: hypothetical protein ACRDJE_00520 [Dehalococcoidia bacterium]